MTGDLGSNSTQSFSLDEPKATLMASDALTLSVPAAVGWTLSDQGSQLARRYVDLGLIAIGGMGEVRQAYDPSLERRVAIKLLGAHLGRSAKAVARFRREAAVLAGLRHASIVSVYDYGLAESGRPFLVMPLLEGQTLSACLRARGNGGGPPTRAQLVQWVGWLRSVALAVAHAHGSKLVHRDLKPSNVQVGEQGLVTVLDWGLARLVDDELEPELGEAAEPLLSGSASLKVTRHGAVQGTVAYMAPEQARGETEGLGAAVDIWGLGAILCEMLTGEPPFGRGSGRAVLERARRCELSPVPHRDQLPAPLVELMERCLAPTAGGRPASALAVAESLEAWLASLDRAAEARRRVDDAELLQQDEDGVLERVLELQSALADATAGLPPEARWELEDTLRQCRIDAAVIGAEVEEKLLSAISAAPERCEARSLLCARLHRQHVDAEARGHDREAQVLELRLRRYDNGLYRDYLDGLGELSVCTSRPVRVELHEWCQVDHSLRAERRELLGTSPVPRRRVPAAEMLVNLVSDDGVEVRVPVRIPRAASAAVGTPEAPVWVPAAHELLPGFVFVPGGPAQIGGDELAAGVPLLPATVDVPAFCIGECPVRLGDYLEFVEDVARTEGSEVAARLLPRLGDEPGDATAPLGLENGRVVRRPDRDNMVWNLDWAAILVSHGEAEAYCRWMARRTGQAIRLPTDEEWEKAARGPFGRVFPWGTTRISSRFAAIRAAEDAACVVPRLEAGAFPVDTSVYGVRFMAGGVREYVRRSAALEESGECVARGGDYGSGPGAARCASRRILRYGARGGATGFRLAYTISR